MHRPWNRALVLGVLAAAVGAAPCAAALPSDLAFIERTGASFVSVRPAALFETAPVKALTPRLRGNLDREVKAAENRLGVAATATERVTAVILPGPDEPLLAVRTAQPYDRTAVLRKVLGPEPTETKHHGRTLVRGRQHNGRCVAIIDERVFVVGSEKQVRRLIDLAEAQHPDRELARGAAWAAEKYHLVAAVRPEAVPLLFGGPRAEMPAMKATAPAAASGQAAPRPPEPPPPPKDRPESEESEGPPAPGPDQPNLEALLAEMPWEAWPYKPLLLAQTALVALDLGDESKLHCRLTFADEPAARDGEMSLRVVLYVVREWIGRLPQELEVSPEAAAKLTPAFRQAQAAVRAAQVRRSGRVMEATLALKTGAADLGGFLAQAEQSAALAEATRHLREIGLGMQSYDSNYNALHGAAICDTDGKPLLSWRVALLPFIEQGNLYQQFKLDEPWDSPNNKKLLDNMPHIYACPGHEAKDQTCFRVFTGPLTPFDLARTRPGPVTLGISWVQFTDGRSNTLLLVEAAESVPWTKPEELPFDPKKPLPKLGGSMPGTFLCVFADGSVHRISTKIDKDLLQALITPAGGEAVDWSAYEVSSGASRPGAPSGATAPAVSSSSGQAAPAANPSSPAPIPPRP